MAQTHTTGRMIENETITADDIKAADAANIRTKIGLGTAAVVNTGTATGNVPVLDGDGLIPAALLPGGAGGGIGGSTGATDNALLRANGTGGALAQSSAITVDDSGNMANVGTVNGTNLPPVTTAADQFVYSTGANALALGTVTAAGRAIIDDADAAAQRTTLGLGTAAVATSSDFQPADATLTAVAALTWVSGVEVKTLTAADTFGTMNVGSAANNLVQLDAGGILPRSSYGMTATQSSHGFSVGDPIYFNGTTWAKARASHAVSLAMAMVLLVPTTGTFVYGSRDCVFTTTGLTAGAVYYLSDVTAGGRLAAGVAPSAVPVYTQRLGYAISSTVFRVDIDQTMCMGVATAGGWTVEWNAHTDGLAASNGFTNAGTGGTHALENDAQGVQRQKVTVAAGVTAFLQYTTSVAANGDAFEIEVDWIPSTAGITSMIGWNAAYATGSGKRFYLTWNTTNVRFDESGDATTFMGAARQNWAIIGQRQVWTIRKSAGTVAGISDLHFNAKNAGGLIYSSLGATASPLGAQYLFGKNTTGLTNTNYFYRIAIKTGGWCSIPPWMRYGTDMVGVP